MRRRSFGAWWAELPARWQARPSVCTFTQSQASCAVSSRFRATWWVSARLVTRRQEEGEATEVRSSVLSPPPEHLDPERPSNEPRPHVPFLPSPGARRTARLRAGQPAARARCSCRLGGEDPRAQAGPVRPNLDLPTIHRRHLAGGALRDRGLRVPALPPVSARHRGGIPAVFRGRPDLRARLRPRAQTLPPRAIAFGCRAPLSAVRPPAADRAAARPKRRGGHVRRGADGGHRPLPAGAVVPRDRLPHQPPHLARGRFAQRELFRGGRGYPSHLVTAASGRARLAVLPGGLRRANPPRRRPPRRDVVAAVAGAVGYLPSHAEHLAVALDARPLQREGERFRAVEVAGTVRSQGQFAPVLVGEPHFRAADPFLGAGGEGVEGRPGHRPGSTLLQSGARAVAAQAVLPGTHLRAALRYPTGRERRDQQRDAGAGH